MTEILTNNAALRELLQDLTDIDLGEETEVRLSEGGGSHAGNDYIQIDVTAPERIAGDVDVSPANLLRMIIDTQDHETAHHLWSDLRIKEHAQQAVPEASKAAAHVANVIEDEYIDSRRVNKRPGLRETRALQRKLWMDNNETTPMMGELSVPEQFVQAFAQRVMGGRVKGWGEAADEVKDFMRSVEPDIQLIPRMHDRHAREDLAERITGEMLRRVRDWADLDEAAEEHAENVGSEDEMPDDPDPSHRCPECGQAIVPNWGMVDCERTEAARQWVAMMVNDGKKGVDSVSFIYNDELAGARIEVDQDAYKTHNHFKHRHDLANGKVPGMGGAMTVTFGPGGASASQGIEMEAKPKLFDIEDGVVEMLRPIETFDETMPGASCPLCGAEWKRGEAVRIGGGHR